MGLMLRYMAAVGHCDDGADSFDWRCLAPVGQGALVGRGDAACLRQGRFVVGARRFWGLV